MSGGRGSQSLVMLMIFQYRRGSDRSHRCGRRCVACGFVATSFLPLLLSIEKPSACWEDTDWISSLKGRGTKIMFVFLV